MVVGRFLAWLMFVLMLVSGVVDVVVGWRTGTWRLDAVGEVWAYLHRNSLLLAEPAIDRHVWPGLWQTVVVPILLLPAAPLFAVLGSVLMLVFRHRQRRPSGLRG